MSKSIWRRVPCPRCGDLISNNALGRNAHIRSCTGEPRHEKEARKRREREEARVLRAKQEGK